MTSERVGRWLLALVVLPGLLAATAAAALAVTVSWGSAIDVPGADSLRGGYNDDFGRVGSVSCASAGDCSAVGLASYGHPFVVSEQGGVWGSAIAAPGTADDVAPWLFSISCAGAGDCTAGGTTWADGGEAIVVSEEAGVWGDATEVPGIAALNVGDNARVDSVSCATAGNCAAAGRYAANTDKYGSPGDLHGFVVSELAGVWGQAQPVPTAPVFTAPVRGRPVSAVDAVSCGGVGDCVAGGSYYLRGVNTSWRWAFVVVESNGKWDTGRRVPGTATLGGVKGQSGVTSVSCASPGNCTAGGYVYPSHAQMFVVDKKNGKWSKAIFVPGMAALNIGGSAWLESISCASAGNCVAGGYYANHKRQAFVVAEKNGKWGKAIEVPGTAALNRGGNASVTSVSCASTGDCAASGSYTDASHKRHAFVVAEQNGVWGTAVKVPGTATLGVGAAASALSCPSAGNCAIGGYSSDSSGYTHPFVTAP